jgi:hypothetical protein
MQLGERHSEVAILSEDLGGENCVCLKRVEVDQTLCSSNQQMHLETELTRVARRLDYG